MKQAGKIVLVGLGVSLMVGCGALAPEPTNVPQLSAQSSGGGLQPLEPLDGGSNTSSAGQGYSDPYSGGTTYGNPYGYTYGNEYGGTQATYGGSTQPKPNFAPSPMNHSVDYAQYWEDKQSARSQVGFMGQNNGSATSTNPWYQRLTKTAVSPEIASHRSTFFKDYGVNPFVETLTDPFSTFSIDVDTASYTLVRSALKQQNQLPPQAAVRVEEMVNFFNYTYAPPQNGDSFAIHTEMALNPFGSGQILRVGLQSKPLSSETRKPARLTFVIDVSGSMDAPQRLGLVKESLKQLVGQLNAQDQVAIVVYGSHAHTVLPMTASQSMILTAIDSLKPDGSTNAEAGLRTAYAVAYEAFSPEAINRVILCSDGVANVGATGPEAILKSIQDYKAKGITLTTLGFGMGDYNDQMMEQLANQGDGFYAYIDSIEEAQRLFIKNLSGTLHTLTKDTKVQVLFNPDIVEQYRLLGYENRDIADADFRNDAIDAGEVGAGHKVTALYEIRLKPGVAQGELARVHLRYKDLDQDGQVVELQKGVQVSTQRKPFERASSDFQLALLSAQFAEILRGSVFAQGETTRDLLSHIQRVSSNRYWDTDTQEFMELIQLSHRHQNSQLSIKTFQTAPRAGMAVGWGTWLDQQMKH